MNHLKFTTDNLDVGKINSMASSESGGAVAVFVEMARDSIDGRKVNTLKYEAYEPTAMKQLELICKELRIQWQDIVNIVIFHRLGFVGIGEASVVVAISSPSRTTSLNAVEAAIDSLNKRVPVWKTEIYQDTQTIWKENKESEVFFNDEPKAFNVNMCHVDDSSSIPCQLIQISVSEEEIKRRIQCFVEKKRNEIDLCNIMDFTDINERELNGEKTKNDDMTCARVSSAVVKQDYSKCHLKVSLVKNNIGPQTSSNYLQTLDKLMVPIKKDDNEDTHFSAHEKESRELRQTSEEHYIFKHPTIVERLKNIEEHLSIPQNQTKNMHQRLKVIEDRLIFLESISPEYGHFLVEKCFVTDNSTRDIQANGMLPCERKTYSINDLENIVQKFEERNPL